MNRPGIHLFSITFLAAAALADLTTGQAYHLKLIGLNGEALSTADGHITIIAVVAREAWPKAQVVGDRVPDSCVRDGIHRMITVVNFGAHSSPIRALFIAGAKHRLNSEIKRIQPRYDAGKITRSPKEDIFAVADFDGTVMSDLGVEATVQFRVLVFGKSGELLAKWDDVPTSEELAAKLNPSH